MEFFFCATVVVAISVGKSFCPILPDGYFLPNVHANLYGAKTEIFWDNQNNKMATDALTVCVTNNHAIDYAGQTYRQVSNIRRTLLGN